MKARNWLWIVSLLAMPAFGQDTRHVTLHEAVQLALQHNHSVRIAALKVTEKQHAKDVAKSAYYPLLRNDTSVVTVTDTQFIAIPAGSLSGSGNVSVPDKTVVINQGGKTFSTSGTSLTQPLTGYLKSRPLNDMAAAELNATRAKSQQVEKDIGLKIHQNHYKLILARVHRPATYA